METIQINNSNKSAILELFGKAVDKENYLIEKKTGKKLICPFSNEHIKVNSFSILPGSALFVNNYYYCFSEYMAKNR